MVSCFLRKYIPKAVTQARYSTITATSNPFSPMAPSFYASDRDSSQLRIGRFGSECALITNLILSGKQRIAHRDAGPVQHDHGNIKSIQSHGALVLCF